MALYTAEVIWPRDGQKFIDKRYSRKHILRCDRGIEVAGSVKTGVRCEPRESMS